jgi:hypothetical protein
MAGWVGLFVGVEVAATVVAVALGTATVEVAVPGGRPVAVRVGCAAVNVALGSAVLLTVAVAAIVAVCEGTVVAVGVDRRAMLLLPPPQAANSGSSASSIAAKRRIGIG